jgi:hypothetical protein
MIESALEVNTIYQDKVIVACLIYAYVILWQFDNQILNDRVKSNLLVIWQKSSSSSIGSTARAAYLLMILPGIENIEYHPLDFHFNTILKYKAHILSTRIFTTQKYNSEYINKAAGFICKNQRLRPLFIKDLYENLTMTIFHDSWVEKPSFLAVAHRLYQHSSVQLFITAVRDSCIDEIEFKTPLCQASIQL